MPAPTLDVLISERIGTTTRFRSLEVNATGVPGQSYSRASESIVNASTRLAARALRAHLRPRLLRSAATARSCPIRRPCCARACCRPCARTRRASRGCSAATTGSASISTSPRCASSRTRSRCRSRRPTSRRACGRARRRARTSAPISSRPSSTHRLMTELLVFALLCDQTRVFNMLFSWGTSELRKSGAADRASSVHPRRAGRPGARLSARSDVVRARIDGRLGRVRRAPGGDAGGRRHAARQLPGAGALRELVRQIAPGHAACR